MNYPEMHPNFERDLRALSDKMLVDVLRADLARPEGATQEHKLQLYISECRRRGFYGPRWRYRGRCGAIVFVLARRQAGAGELGFEFMRRPHRANEIERPVRVSTRRLDAPRRIDAGTRSETERAGARRAGAYLRNLRDLTQSPLLLRKCEDVKSINATSIQWCLNCTLANKSWRSQFRL
jgi:hypothetical protein